MFFICSFSIEQAYNSSLDLFGWKIIDKKHTKITYVQDTFTVHKSHIKCTVVQKEAHWPPFSVWIFNYAIYVENKNILYKKSLICLITGTNLLKGALYKFKKGTQILNMLALNLWHYFNSDCCEEVSTLFCN